MCRCDDRRATIRSKMLYAGSVDAMKRVFTGLAYKFEVRTLAEMKYSKLCAEIEKRA